MKIIDAHIHFDQYVEEDREEILAQQKLAGLLAVSMDELSAYKTLELARRHPKVFPAVGYHPEQDLPEEGELERILTLLERERERLVAVGEVGLPYYLRQENPGLDFKPYVDLLRVFMKEAVRLDLPLVLHAVYEDAGLVCDLLEEYGVGRAHFHWFKGDLSTIRRMIRKGYYISVTPDLLYKERTRDLVWEYPLDLLMVETDGPWRFEGPFMGLRTDPAMLYQVIGEIARLKERPVEMVADALFRNTVKFYSLEGFLDF